jgi:glycosyltransferase involved in cell wall biosynthesis
MNPSNSSNNFLLSIIIPIYNESENIDELVKMLVDKIPGMSNTYELIFIDDGSSDDSFTKLCSWKQQYSEITIIQLSRNFGKEVAMSAGLDHAKGDAVVIIDADFQHPVDSIHDMIRVWKDGYDMVYGIPNQRNDETVFKRLSTSAFYWIINQLSDTPIPKHAGDFRLMDRKVVNALKQLPERKRFMKGLYAWVGFKHTSIIFDRGKRRKGTSKWKKSELFRYAFDGITTFSVVPIKILGMLGVFISGGSIVYAIFLVIKTVVYGIDLPGYASLMVSSLFLNGIILIAIRILGEYIARIFLEIKGRPLYIIREIK